MSVPQVARVLNCDTPGLVEAGVRLRAGQCVAFPTETVYGLGANALDRDAVLSIFRHKGRPLTDPLIVHVVDTEAALALVQLRTAEAIQLFRLLASSFWPGPLTLVARAVAALPGEVTASTGFVGVRVPAHDTALALLRTAGVPVAAPSANRFGHVSPTLASHVLADLGATPITVLLGEGGSVDGDGGAGGSSADGGGGGGTCSVGIESTVVKIDEGGAPGEGEGLTLIVYRLGGVSLARIRAALAAVPSLAHVPCAVRTAYHAPPGAEGHGAVAAPSLVSPALGPSESQSANSSAATGGASDSTTVAGGGGGGVGAEAPGLLLTHYAPDLRCVLASAVDTAGEEAGAPLPADTVLFVEGGAASTSSDEHLPLASLVVLDCGGTCAGLRGRALAYRDLAPGGDLGAARAGIFAGLRWAESVAGAAAVALADPFLAPGAERDDAEALRDRMFRACSGRTGTLRWRARA